MGTIQRFEELEIWQKARVMENKIFLFTKSGQLSKDYNLKVQMNRSSGSVLDNTAEGFGRGSRLEFINFLRWQEDLQLKFNPKCIAVLTENTVRQNSFGEYYDLADEICKMITAFIGYLNKTDFKGQKYKERKKEIKDCSKTPNSKLKISGS